MTFNAAKLDIAPMPRHGIILAVRVLAISGCTAMARQAVVNTRNHDILALLRHACTMTGRARIISAQRALNQVAAMLEVRTRIKALG